MDHEQDPRAETLTEVLRSIDPMAVQIARDLLSATGIEAFIFDGAASRMLGGTAAVTTRLMVYADRAQEARDCLKELGFTS